MIILYISFPYIPHKIKKYLPFNVFNMSALISGMGRAASVYTSWAMNLLPRGLTPRIITTCPGYNEYSFTLLKSCTVHNESSLILK